MALSVKRTPRGECVRETLLELAELGGLLEQRVADWTKPHGETPARYKVLTAAGCDRFTVPQIARRMGMTRQGVQRVANILVTEELAQFVENPDHRSSPILELTEAGRLVDDNISSDIAADNNSLGRRQSLVEWQALADGLANLRELL